MGEYISAVKSRRITVVFILILLASAGASAQSLPAAQPSPTPQVKPTPSLESRFVKNILRDQSAIWTSPFHAARGDSKWLAPLGGAAALLFATDRRTGGEMLEGDNNSTRLRISREISRGGSIYATGGIAAAFYIVGRSTDNARARETGLLGAEALIDSGIVVTVLKSVSRRQRPPTDNASGEFFSGGNSFPSGHAISAWSLATVFANEYGHDRPLLRFGAYGLATAVSLSRFTGRNHFLSDVLVGSALGYGIGRFVYVKHHDPALDGDSMQHSSFMRSKFLPFVAPRYNGGARREREYGVALAWNL